MKTKIITAIIIGLFLLSGYFIYQTNFNKSENSKVEDTQPITIAVPPAEFARLLKDDKYVVIDLRTPAEIREGKISAKALEVDFYAPDFKNRLNRLDKTKPYLIYCRSGNRSGKTAKLMKELGFTNVTELRGGVNAWLLSGRALVKEVSVKAGGPDMIYEGGLPDRTDNNNWPAGNSPQATETPDNDSEPVFCTMDAKQCPDGSYVGRVAPDCSFAPCPGD